MHETTSMGLGHAVALLAAMVVAATLFRRFGLGAVLGYLAAGLLIGPSALGVVDDPQSVLHVAEFGVVMFLFIIGLEMRPARLWSLRKEIFGLGAVQVLACALLLTGIALLAGLAWYAALIAGFGFALSSTAIVMQLLQERNENTEPGGQRVVSILLFEDLAIVPLLALVAVLAGAWGSSVETGYPIWMTIGLEMRPARLWSLRKEIFGLGAVQVLASALLLTGTALAAGLTWYAALIAGFGFALSSTAIVMQLLQERNENTEPGGQRVVSILLFEDLAIVPLLALVAVLAGAYGSSVETGYPIWMTIGLAIAAVALVYVAGRWIVNPFFRLLARYGGREVMTMGALFVVLGAAYAMNLGGLSMAMGAFLAGVLLSESTFRHQLEADVEPFRGLLLGLFFLSVGMSLDLRVVVADWAWVLGGLAAFMTAKMVAVYAVARIRQKHGEGLLRAALMGEGGEFAFVLYSTAFAAGLFDARTAAILSAVVILSMALTPLRVMLADRLRPNENLSPDDADGVDRAKDLRERVLIIGFGRFAQVVSQPLLARDVDVSIIDTDVEMIQAAGNFGFKVFYGDGSRLDVLRASGAENAETVLVCVDKPEDADRIVELVKAEFPLTKLFVRAFDRGHSLRLVEAGVEYQLRETFESALVFGHQVLIDLGFSDEEARETIEDVRRRDEERFTLQLSGGLQAGRSLMRGNMATPQPAPYVKPRREGRALNEEAAEALEDEDDREKADA